jgi:hypothetical protein
MVSPTKIVVEANDVVLAKVIAILNLDEDQLVWARVLYAMPRSSGNIDRLSGAERVGNVIEDDDCVTSRHEPVLRTVLVELIAETLACAYRDALDLVPRLVIKHEIGTPRSLTGLSIWHLHIVARNRGAR